MPSDRVKWKSSIDNTTHPNMWRPNRHMLYIDGQYSGSVYEYGGEERPLWISVKHTDIEPYRADTVEEAKAALVAVAVITGALK